MAQPRRRVPTDADFAALSPALTVSLHAPSPLDSARAILILLHGLGDSEASTQRLAARLALPAVLALAVRGTSPLPPALLDDDTTSPPSRFHWGDDLAARPEDGADAPLDPDPGFARAAALVLDRLITETLVEQCGWRLADVVLLGLGQGASLALGLASRIRMEGGKFRGLVAVGGALPTSMVSTVSGRPRAATPVLLCYGSKSTAVDDEAVDVVREEFADVQVDRWKKAGDSLDLDPQEARTMMQFLQDRLYSVW